MSSDQILALLLSVEREASELIQSLREERDQALHVRDEARGMLDGARRNNRELEEGLQDAHRQLHRIGKRERDAERDQIVDLIMDPRFDHLLDSRATCEIVAAIRNNEHRSNEHRSNG